MNASTLIDPQTIPVVSQDDLVLTPSSDQAAPPAAIPPKVRPTPGVWEALLWTCGFMFMTQFVPAIGLVIGSVDSTGNLEIRNDLILPTLLVGQMLGVCLSVLILRMRVGRDWMSAIQVRRPALKPCLLAVACVPAMLLIGSVVETSIKNLFGIKEPTAEIISEGMKHYPMWFCILVIAVGASVNEELFCRGFLGRGLVGRYGILIGMLLTSVIFGAIHLNLPQSVWACILGFFLHLTYLATRSLWVPLLLHFLNNAIAVLLESAIPDFEPTMWQAVMIAIPTFAIAIPAAWALYRLRESKMADSPDA